MPDPTPAEQERCGVVLSPSSGVAQVVVSCKLLLGHKGEHEGAPMPDPTPAEQERARAIAGVCYVNDPNMIATFCERPPYYPHDKPCGACQLTDKIAAAFAEQRKRDAEAVEAAGDKHAGLIGKDVPQRMAHIAALYLRSGYDADAIRREDA